MTAELGSTYADTGGIYSWVVRAFGGFWGTQVSWWYWINVAIWVPSVYLMFSTLLGQMFDFTVGFWWTVGMAVALIWINLAINVITLDTSKWVTNIAAIITVAIMLLIGVAGLVHLMTDGSATEWTSADMLPGWGSMVLLGVVIYNFLGFELMSSASEEMQEPKKDVPRSIFTAGVLIAVFYLIAIVGMLFLLPTDGFNRTNGLFRVLETGIGSSGFAGVVVTRSASGRCTASSPLSSPGRSVRTGPPPRRPAGRPATGARAHQQALPHPGGGSNGHRPGRDVLHAGLRSGDGAQHQPEGRDTVLEPVRLQHDGLPALLPGDGAAFLKLRYSDPDAPRPYRVPGGKVGAWITSTLVFGFIAAAMVFFMWWPGALWHVEGYQNYVTAGRDRHGARAGARRRPRAARAALAADVLRPRGEFEHPEATRRCGLEGIAPDDAATLHDAVGLDERTDATR